MGSAVGKSRSGWQVLSGSFAVGMVGGYQGGERCRELTVGVVIGVGMVRAVGVVGAVGKSRSG